MEFHAPTVAWYPYIKRPYRLGASTQGATPCPHALAYNCCLRDFLYIVHKPPRGLLLKYSAKLIGLFPSPPLSAENAARF